MFSLPTGEYKRDSAFNTGSNSWVVTPHYVFTWQITDKVEISGRINYAWTSKNDDPATYLNAHDVQPGQALHGNLSVSYALSDGLRVGINGYQLKQISDDKIDGHNQHDSREKVTGIGPGLMYQKGPNVFFANYFTESGAQNRAEGNLLNLRYIYLF